MRQRSLFGRNNISLTAESGGLVVATPYDFAFVDALKKRIPATDRKWEPTKRAWVVAPAHGSVVQALIAIHYNEDVDLPVTVAHSQPQLAMKLLDVRYIGAVKGRDDGTETAFGWSGGGWSVIFPKLVLMTYFGQVNRPGESQTLYGVLGVGQAATADELKRSWRRLVMQWHPDRAREPGAREQFESIQAAYDVLGDEKKRARYDAGLALEAAYSKEVDVGAWAPQGTWRCPVRCGLILANGVEQLGRFVVEEILQWGDIVDAQGRVLVTTWAMGDDSFTESWVEQ